MKRPAIKREQNTPHQVPLSFYSTQARIARGRPFQPFADDVKPSIKEEDVKEEEDLQEERKRRRIDQFNFERSMGPAPDPGRLPTPTAVDVAPAPLPLPKLENEDLPFPPTDLERLKQFKEELERLREFQQAGLTQDQVEGKDRLRAEIAELEARLLEEAQREEEEVVGAVGQARLVQAPVAEEQRFEEGGEQAEDEASEEEDSGGSMFNGEGSDVEMDEDVEDVAPRRSFITSFVPPIREKKGKEVPRDSEGECVPCSHPLTHSKC